MKTIIIEKDFEELRNYVTNINNFVNVDYIEKYLKYIKLKYYASKF